MTTVELKFGNFCRFIDDNLIDDEKNLNIKSWLELCLQHSSLKKHAFKNLDLFLYWKDVVHLLSKSKNHESYIFRDWLQMYIEQISLSTVNLINKINTLQLKLQIQVEKELLQMHKTSLNTFKDLHEIV